MKARHHFWSSLAAGGALYWATGSSAALAGSMVGGFLIDADHIYDQASSRVSFSAFLLAFVQIDAKISARSIDQA